MSEEEYWKLRTERPELRLTVYGHLEPPERDYVDLMTHDEFIAKRTAQLLVEGSDFDPESESLLLVPRIPYW